MINSFSGEYRFLSNFWACSIAYEGLLYPSAENAYQAQKAEDKEQFLSITPGQAKRLGKSFEKENWSSIKTRIMEDILVEKFKQNPLLAAKLVSTYPHKLVEGNNWGDIFWGVCNNKGLNLLGTLLMRIRKMHAIRAGRISIDHPLFEEEGQKELL